MLSTANQIADAILDLINSQPRSPTKDELAAIIAKAVSTPDVVFLTRFLRLDEREETEAPRLRAEWDTLSAELLVVDAKWGAIDEAIDGYTDAERAAEENSWKVQERVSDCAQRIVREPVRSPEDLMLLAEACYWAWWTDPQGLCGPNAEAFLADGPPHAGNDLCDEALAALLRAIRDGQPTAAISAPAAPLNAARDKYLASDWNRALTKFLDERARIEETPSDDEFLGLCCEGGFLKLCEQYYATARAIWARPVRNFDNLVELAAIEVTGVVSSIG
jgi:hypothetical protein